MAISSGPVCCLGEEVKTLILKKTNWKLILKGGCDEEGFGHFSQATNRTRGDGHELCQRRFRVDIKKNFFSQRVVRRWNGCPGRWWSRHLAVFKRCLDEELQDMV